MSKKLVPGLVHVAGNAAVDVLLQDVDTAAGSPQGGWGDNVRFHDTPIVAALGGNGAAPAYVLGKLGLRVRLVANVEQDAWGGLLRIWLAEAGINPEVSARHSAVNVISLTSDGRRRSTYYTGEKVMWNRSLTGDTPEWFFAAGYGQVDETDLKALAEIFASLRRRGTKICFDPGPWFWGRAEPELMSAVWQDVHCLVGTEEELSPWASVAGPEELAATLLNLGPEIVVVKRGPKGAIFATGKVPPKILPTRRIAGANTVGAGDTFNGRLLCGLCRDEPIEEAVSAALQLATDVVRRSRGVLGAFS